jgi:hypothetical protein
MRKFTVVLLMVTVLALFFTGCGTTKKIVEDNDTEEVLLAPLSTAIVESEVYISESLGEYWLASTDAGVGIPEANIEVYLSSTYTAENLIGTTTVAPNGTFAVKLDPKFDPAYSGCYVVQIESGKRRSPAVFVTM